MFVGTGTLLQRFTSVFYICKCEHKEEEQNHNLKVRHMISLFDHRWLVTVSVLPQEGVMSFLPGPLSDSFHYVRICIRHCWVYSTWSHFQWGKHRSLKWWLSWRQNFKWGDNWTLMANNAAPECCIHIIIITICIIWVSLRFWVITYCLVCAMLSVIILLM